MLPVNQLAGTQCVPVSIGYVRVGAPRDLDIHRGEAKACVGEASQVVELLGAEAPVVRSCS